MTVFPLHNLEESSVSLIGGKAKQLYALKKQGFKIPNGMVISTQSYQHYISETGLIDILDIELGRKKLDTMRWEELWDTALRIKTHFLKNEIPSTLHLSIMESLGDILKSPVAVRSSSIKEDSEGLSFAGIHESFINISNETDLMKAIRMVWASLWSDAALLYRKELNLSFSNSAMAVIIQEMALEDVSGVAFGQDPTNNQLEHEIIEAIHGNCDTLVSGKVAPQKWILDKQSGEVLRFFEATPNSTQLGPLLNKQNLRNIHLTLRRIQKHLRFEPDIEWTGTDENFTLLQARPITTGQTDTSDKRNWYLSLRPNSENLKALCEKVTQKIIPALDKAGRNLAKIDLENTLTNTELAEEIQHRKNSVEQWRAVYVDDLIPFAHGVRAFGSFYNTLKCPSDPYEFVKLLSSKNTLAEKRNSKLKKLAHTLSNTTKSQLVNALEANKLSLEELKEKLSTRPQGKIFFNTFKELLYEEFDSVYLGKRLLNHPSFVITELLKLAEIPNEAQSKSNEDISLEKDFLNRLNDKTKDYGIQSLEIAKLSWQLRDDDNILLSRIESQYLRALEEGAKRLKNTGQLAGGPAVSEDDAGILIDLLQTPQKKGTLNKQLSEKKEAIKPKKIAQRQVNGQPASPGLATGKACIISCTEDLNRFESGNILVCEAIEPQMTYVICRAAAVIERRGGMLIHGAIIARELGIPCVNGVTNLDVTDGELLTVDGYLGIVSIGPSKLEMFN